MDLGDSRAQLLQLLSITRPNASPFFRQGRLRNGGLAPNNEAMLKNRQATHNNTFYLISLSFSFGLRPLFSLNRRKQTP